LCYSAIGLDHLLHRLVADRARLVDHFGAVIAQHLMAARNTYRVDFLVHADLAACVVSGARVIKKLLSATHHLSGVDHASIIVANTWENFAMHLRLLLVRHLGVVHLLLLLLLLLTWIHPTREWHLHLLTRIWHVAIAVLLELGVRIGRLQEVHLQRVNVAGIVHVVKNEFRVLLMDASFFQEVG